MIFILDTTTNSAKMPVPASSSLASTLDVPAAADGVGADGAATLTEDKTTTASAAVNAVAPTEPSKASMRPSEQLCANDPALEA